MIENLILSMGFSMAIEENTSQNRGKIGVRVVGVVEGG